MFSESRDVLVQIEEPLHRHFELKLRQVGEGVMQDFGYEVLNKDNIGRCNSFCRGDNGHGRIQRHRYLKQVKISLELCF